MSITDMCDRIIRYSFYALFFCVPLFFANDTSELFELNKMWLTWGLALVIATAWVTKMLATKTVNFQRTPLDPFIALFLLSQIISTIFSLDSRISFWGYYSRFNGGLLSLITYAFLYYAFVSNLRLKEVWRSLIITLTSGVVVSLWGLPSHFGKDPTCLLFRGTFDVSCWTEAFHPTVRIFSTLGQPAWMAAYLACLLPLAMSFLVANPVHSGKVTKQLFGSFLFFWIASITLFFVPKQSGPILLYLLFLIGATAAVLIRFGKERTFLKLFGISFLIQLFYLDLLFANTRGGFIAFWLANITFWGILLLRRVLPLRQLLHYAAVCNITFLLFMFFWGTSFNQINTFTFPQIASKLTAKPAPVQPKTIAQQSSQEDTPIGTGITESGNIRKIVWQGALDAWKEKPLFGSGVETFAFAYYKHRPVEHNMTSEWDYLYNKAHNEYLNYLTTTGIVGLGTHGVMLAVFILLCLKFIFSQRSSVSQTQEKQMMQMPHSDPATTTIFIIGLLSSYVSIIISNFFGFSVVMINIFLFLIPAWMLSLSGHIPQAATSANLQKKHRVGSEISAMAWTGIIVITLFSLFLLFLLFRFREADKAYGLGYNLDRVNEYPQAYLKLIEATDGRSEPVFKDELSVNKGTLAAMYFIQKDATRAQELAKEAILLSDEVVTTHPNNIVFWKTRVRMFYALAQVDQRYLGLALESIKKAHELAPTDAKISYNLGVLYGQTGEIDKAISILRETVKLKPDYSDAYYGLALFYRMKATDNTPTIKDPKAQEQAEAIIKDYLRTVNPKDTRMKELLKSWGVAS